MFIIVSTVNVTRLRVRPYGRRSGGLSQVDLAHPLKLTHSQAARCMCLSCMSRTSCVQPRGQGTTATMSSGFLLLGNDRLVFVQAFSSSIWEPNNYYSGTFQLTALLTSSSINLRQGWQVLPLVASSGYLCGCHLLFGLEEERTCNVTYSLRVKLVHWTSSAENRYTNISEEWGLKSTSPCVGSSHLL